MTSQRLPGKPLEDLEGRELLGRVLDRVRAAKTVSRVIVATSTQDTDDALSAFCDRESTHCFRAAMDDVASRLLAAADFVGASAFVRISGDSPVIDPQLIDHAVHVYSATRPDLVTNVSPRTFPAGQSVEVVKASALRKLWSQQSDAADAAELNEHVTTGFYRSPESWDIVNFTSGLLGPHPSMAVDTPEDLVRIRQLIQRASGGLAGWRDLLELQVNP
jgi:spore coat polysaccharide biosynthesis protein SpsF